MSKARILAVDDQLYFRVFLEELLSAEGYEVCSADGGEAALHLLERENVDVVLTDLVMPDMSGAQLVERIKERWPDQDVVVITSVSDAQTAVDAMRRGASDYLLKPVDRTFVTRTLEGILQKRRLRREHAHLMAENLEYLAVLSVYERAMSLSATLALEPLAERIVDGLCVETRAQGGVLWLPCSEHEPNRLILSAARGLVSVEHEPEELSLQELPADLTQLSDPNGAAFLTTEEENRDSQAAALIVPLRQAGRLLGFARLTDKLAGAVFEGRDRAVAERFAEPAAIAVANALRVRSLERRSFRDPVTKAYTWAYFEDLLRNEIQKAGRFGRSFSLIQLELDRIESLRNRMSATEFASRLEAFAVQVGRVLRATDLLAVEGDGRYALLLPETDALGAVVLKRRLRELLDRDDPFGADGREPAPVLRLAAASFPVDGSQLETLLRTLVSRVDEERQSLCHQLALAGRRLPEMFRELAAHGETSHPEALETILRFVVSEVERRAGERGLFCVAPGTVRLATVVEGLARLDPPATRTEVVLVTETRPDALAGAPITFVSPQRAATAHPFLVYYAEGPAYALVGEPAPDGKSLQLFQTSDRVLVEQIAFRLQRDLSVPIGR